MRTALMLAFHFPPFAQSSGSIRTISFVRHLSANGWKPIVLTAREAVYPDVDQRSLAMVPAGSDIVRAPGLDIARHLAIAGRYPNWLATPDRWNTWAACAFLRGLACIRRYRPHVLWATFPIASALAAAMALRRFSHIPLILDLRDPLVYEGWPNDRWTRRSYSRIERRAVAVAAAVVVTTPGARRLYVERYPNLPLSRFRLIANGIDDAMPTSELNALRAQPAPLLLVHSGLMEIPDRDPSALFEAIAKLRERGEVSPETLRVVLRASGRDAAYRRQIAELKIDGIVRVEGRVSHPEALEEMRRADGLLLLQGAQCGRQIPAKAYEYLACRRPIIGLLDPAGDTHELISKQWQIPYVGAMDSAPEIAEVLRKFIGDCRAQQAFVPAASLLDQHSRAAGARQLAQLFDEVSNRGADV
ncbi:MAG: glycosyltransferase [Burkholderiaceae bacterium]